MEDPFFRTYYPPFYARNATPSSRRSHQNQQQAVKTTTSPSSRKLVTIPVHFVETEKARSIAAMKIQKVFRGFLVRKSVKKIVGVKREVDVIERRMEEKETVELIKKEVKERLKVNEMLMALLFQLDSVHGVDSAVRDLRKAVIKKVILLQERVDRVVDQDKEDVKEEIKDYDEILVGEQEEVKETLDVKEVVDDEIKDCDEIEGDIVVGEEEVKEEETDEVKDIGDAEIKDCDEIVESLMSCEDETPEKKNQTDLMSESEFFEETVMDCAIDKEVECENGENQEKKDESVKMVEERGEGEEVFEEMPKEEGIDEKKVVMEMQQSDKIQEEDGAKDLMERMMEKNEKLMGLMTELCERNALQSQMINSLSQRVESLEKAMKRKKKKRQESLEKAMKRKKKKRQEKGDVGPNVRRCGRKSEETD